MKSFLSKPRKQTKIHLPPLFNNALNILGRTLRHEEKQEGVKTRKGKNNLSLNINNMVVYLKNSKELLELKDEFIKVA